MLSIVKSVKRTFHLIKSVVYVAKKVFLFM